MKFLSAQIDEIRDVIAGRYLRIGSLYLRNNANVLEKSTDSGSTWSTLASGSSLPEVDYLSRYLSITNPAPATVITDAPTANLAMRYKADDIVGNNLDPVSSWPSANGLPAAVQATSTNQPRLLVNAMNGHKVVEFDGTTDRLALTGVALDVARNKQNLLVSIAYKMPDVAVVNTRALFSLSTGTTTGARVALLQREAAGAHQASGRRLDADGFASTQGGTTVQGEFVVLTAIYRWATNDLILYKSGVEVASNLSFQAAGTTSDTASLTGFIGANAAGTAEFFSGQIAEILAYNTADTDNSVRLAVEKYYTDTYNGTAMPIGNLAGGWTQIYTEDFLTPIPEGGFVPLTSGDKGMFTADNPYATKFKGKSIDEIPGYEPTTRYDSAATLSVVTNITGTNGVLRNRIQKRADGTVRAGAMKPLFGNGVDFSTPTKIRWRSRAYGGPGHSYVYDFIASNTDWTNGGGELGFWENGVNYTGANVFYRPKTATTTGDYTATKQQFQAPNVNHQDWNVMDAEWIPGVSLILSCNGKVFYTDTNVSTVWTVPQRWVMQSGANFANAVIGSDGFVECDWVTVWTKP